MSFNRAVIACCWVFLRSFFNSKNDRIDRTQQQQEENEKEEENGRESRISFLTRDFSSLLLVQVINIDFNMSKLIASIVK